MFQWGQIDGFAPRPLKNGIFFEKTRNKHLTRTDLRRNVAAEADSNECNPTGNAVLTSNIMFALPKPKKKE
jgi:hypothetical protein